MKSVKIYGLGWVGKSMKSMFPDAIVDDPSLGLNPTEVCDVAFVCVPTPNLDDGSLDSSIVESVVARAKEDLIVIRSTVMPGTTGRLSFDYEKKIVFQPEYLGETVDHPMINQKQRQFIILGGSKEDTEKVIEVYQDVYNANVSIRQTDSYTAEVIKLTENRAIAFKVAQCQELYDACKKSNVNYNTVREAVYGDDPRFNLWFTFVYPEKRGFLSKCVLPDTKIYTPDGYKLADNINEGDYVLTHDGSFQEVLEVFERDVSEKVLKIIPQGLDGFSLTKEHPVFAVKTNRHLQGVKRRKLSNYNGDYALEWVNSENLQKGDFLSVPNIQLQEEKLPNDILRLIGYYIAEGHCAKTGEITFAFHSKEISYIEDIKEIVIKYYPTRISKKNKEEIPTKFSEHKEGNIHNLSFVHHELAKFLKHYGGERHNTKKIHYDILLSKNIGNLLTGYFRGDGSQSDGVITMVTTSENLFYQIKMILWAHNISFTTSIKKSFVDKNGVKHKKAYYLRIRNYSDIEKFNDLCGSEIKKDLKLSRNTTPRKDKKILIPIKSINEFEYIGKVINFEIENNNTYVINDAIVHNCIPKDVYGWEAWAESLGVTTELTSALLSYNDKLIKR